jgi:GntR family transcriptional regulator
MDDLKDPAAVLHPAIDRYSPLPYYAQVLANLQDAIETDLWPPGTRLPGEPVLCELFSVSRTVIRQALRELEYRGLVVRRKGVGTFVAEPKILESLVQKLTGFYQDMIERGYSPVTRVLKQSVVPANPKVAAILEIEPGTDVIEMERLRSINGEPIVLVKTELPYKLCPDVATADFSNQSLYEFLNSRYGLEIARGRRVLEAVQANERESELLQIPLGKPLMLLDSVSYLHDGTPIERYHAVHRGDRSRFEVELIRIRPKGTDRQSLADTLNDMSV